MTFDQNPNSPRIIAPGGPVSRAVAAMSHEPEPPRRSFLRGLAKLPLIGGGVALIGSPVRAAQPVTPGMIATYSAWLAYERSSLMHACGIGRADDMIPFVNPGSRFHFTRPVDLKTWGLDAVERAPVMLAAAGCELTDAEAEKTWATTFRPIAWQEGGR